MYHAARIACAYSYVRIIGGEPPVSIKRLAESGERPIPCLRVLHSSRLAKNLGNGPLSTGVGS